MGEKRFRANRLRIFSNSPLRTKRSILVPQGPLGIGIGRIVGKIGMKIKGLNKKNEKNNFEVVRQMTIAATCDATWIVEVIANHRTAGGLDRVLQTIMTASIPSSI